MKDQAHPNESPEAQGEDTSATEDTQSASTQEQVPPPTPEEDWQGKYIRLYAEFENTKKRLHRDRLLAHRMANKHLILDLLPTLDNLVRAIENLSETQETQQGLTLILTNLQKTLADKGLQPMHVQIGQDPNPQEHHILTQAETTQQELKGKITQIVTQGYLLHDQVIRPAQVIIGA